jgi:hypothetical protein
MEYLPLISIPVIYFAVALIKPYINSSLPFNLCAICVAVSLTWLGLLVLWLMGYTVSLLVLGILMGMSVTGIMYKSEGLYKNLKIKNFWFVRLVIIIGGFYGIFVFLQKEWQIFSLIAISSLFLIIIATFLFQGVTHREALKEVKKKDSIIQKLNDCC